MSSLTVIGVRGIIMLVSDFQKDCDECYCRNTILSPLLWFLVWVVATSAIWAGGYIEQQGLAKVRRGSTDPPHRPPQPATTPSTLPAPPLAMGRATDDMRASQMGPARDRSVVGHVICAGRGPPGARRGPRRLAYCVADLCRGYWPLLNLPNGLV